MAKIVTEASRYVQELLNSRLPETMLFHSPQHTQLVYNAVTQISGQLALSKTETIQVQLAALFHDTGYAFQYIGHEEVSMAIAGTFLIQHGCNQPDFEQILACIAATRMPQAPKNQIEEVLCDADFYHFTLPDYQQYAARLKKEWENYLNIFYTEEQWLKLNISMLTTHQYFTAFGKSKLQALKQKNIDVLTAKL